jgi:hypothetical protein
MMEGEFRREGEFLNIVGPGFVQKKPPLDEGSFWTNKYLPR